jgi:hypothetical protein
VVVDGTDKFSVWPLKFLAQGTFGYVYAYVSPLHPSSDHSTIDADRGLTHTKCARSGTTEKGSQVANCALKFSPMHMKALEIPFITFYYEKMNGILFDGEHIVSADMAGLAGPFSVVRSPPRRLRSALLEILTRTFVDTFQFVLTLCDGSVGGVLENVRERAAERTSAYGPTDGTLVEVTKDHAKLFKGMLVAVEEMQRPPIQAIHLYAQPAKLISLAYSFSLFLLLLYSQ